jgi:hypothetical protein
MLRRLLNIASVVCLVVCVALIGLWVTLNYRCIEVHGHLPFRQTFQAFTAPGRIWANWDTLNDNRMPSDVSPWSIKWRPDGWFSLGRDPSNPPGLLEKLGIAAGHDNIYGWVVVSPLWFLVLATGSLAMAFQLRLPPRFTLRNLFILTTFLAVVLGMIAWLDHPWIGK